MYIYIYVLMYTCYIQHKFVCKTRSHRQKLASKSNDLPHMIDVQLDSTHPAPCSAQPHSFFELAMDWLKGKNTSSETQICLKCFLVGGLNPSEKYQSIGMIIPNIWENKKCSKPPTRKCFYPPQQSISQGFPVEFPQKMAKIQALRVPLSRSKVQLPGVKHHRQPRR